MKTKILSTVVLGTIGLLAFGCVHRPAGTQDRIRELVAQEAQAELAMWRRSFPEISGSQIELERIETAMRDIELWSARIPLDHWHRYVVAHRNGKVWRLGGFAQPELQPFSLEAGLGTGEGAREIAKRLIVLADPNGSSLVFVSDLNVGDPLHQAWMTAREAAWPVDTIATLNGTVSLIRLSILSNEEHSYARAWTPFLYTFVFDANARLLAWTRREGRKFN